VIMNVCALGPTCFRSTCWRFTRPARYPPLVSATRSFLIQHLAARTHWREIPLTLGSS
jgi:hypothetical protein